MCMITMSVLYAIHTAFDFTIVAIHIFSPHMAGTNIFILKISNVTHWKKVMSNIFAQFKPNLTEITYKFPNMCACVKFYLLNASYQNKLDRRGHYIGGKAILS